MGIMSDHRKKPASSMCVPDCECANRPLPEMAREIAEANIDRTTRQNCQHTKHMDLDLF